MNENETTRHDMANRIFFRLYQCANMLHKTGSRAVEQEGLTTQQWAVLGALSRDSARAGMSLGDLARYLMVSRQNLSGLISRMERDRLVQVVPDDKDRRSRLVVMTAHGQDIWQVQAQDKIHAYYEAVLGDFSVTDMTHTLHYLIRMLESMDRVDSQQLGSSDADPEDRIPDL